MLVYSVYSDENFYIIYICTSYTKCIYRKNLSHSEIMSNASQEMDYILIWVVDKVLNSGKDPLIGFKIFGTFSVGIIAGNGLLKLYIDHLNKFFE